jgi:hypothetical protein
MTARVLRVVAATAVAVVVFAGCSDAEEAAPPRDPRLAELEERRDRWEERAPGEYRYTLTLQCFCAPPANQPVTVTVRDGEVVAVEPAIGEAEPGGQLPLRIEELFDTAAEAIADADRVEIDYDREFDFPASIAIDALAEAIDDETTYLVTDFEVVAA